MPFPGAVRATARRRLLAAGVDVGLVLLMGGGFALLGAVRAVAAARAGEPVTTVPLVAAGLVVALAFVAFQCWLEGEYGVTAGKRVVGLVTVAADGGRPIGTAAMARRYALGVADARGWHTPDVPAVVLDVRLGADPMLVLQPPAEVDEWPSLWVSRSRRAVDQVPTQVTRPDVGGPAGSARAAGSAGTLPEVGPYGLAVGMAPPPVGPPVPLPPPPGLAGAALAGSAPAGAPPGASPGVVLELWDGRRVRLTGLAVVGRAPGPRPTDPSPELRLAVRDPERAVSKTHLAVGVDRTGVWVRDHSSLNGTVVVLADGIRVPCPPERRVRIPRGAAIAFGSFEIRIGAA